MTSSSHLASSALCYLAASALLESPVSLEGLAVTAFGSLLPDIDAPTSSIGRPFFPLAGWINRKVGHRTLTHSLLGTGLLAGLAIGSAWIVQGWLAEAAAVQYAWLLVLGYASHVLVDTLNKTGVELFWPARIRCVFFTNERYRIASGGSGDYWFMVICLLLNLALYPVAQQGFTLSLHRAFGDVYSVALDYRQYGDRRLVRVDLEGVEVLSNQKMKGSYEILAALDNASLLIDRDGVKQIVSRSEPHHIWPTSARIEIGEKQSVTVHQTNMAGRTLGELPVYPGTRRVLYFGYLTPARLASLSLPVDRYSALTLRLDKIRLQHAELADIRQQGLEHVLIREGTILAKTAYRPVIHSPSSSGASGQERLLDREKDLEWKAKLEWEAAQPATLPDAQPATPIKPLRLIQLRFRPDDRILFKEGDVVQRGQVLARKNTAPQREKLETDDRRDRQQLENRLAEAERELAVALGELGRFQAEAESLSAELARLGGNPLFSRERLRLGRNLESASQSVRQASRRTASLESRAQQLRIRLRDRETQHQSALNRLETQSRVLSTFTGTLVRIEIQADGEKLLYSLFYRQ